MRYFADWQTAQCRSERALNHKIQGKITKIRALSGRFPPNARIPGRAQIYPGDLLTLEMCSIFPTTPVNRINESKNMNIDYDK